MKGATFEEVAIEYIEQLRLEGIEFGTCVLLLKHKFEIDDKEAARIVAKYINNC